MSVAVIPIHLSEPLFNEATAQAHKRGQSIEDWLQTVAEERIREEQASEKFFDRAAKLTSEEARKALSEVLAQVPDNPPMPGDELPEGWSPDQFR